MAASTRILLGATRRAGFDLRAGVHLLPEAPYGQRSGDSFKVDKPDPGPRVVVRSRHSQDLTLPTIASVEIPYRS
ncbi:hypothetical protein ABIA00_001601 [Bradyrhizobium ottawaense]|jgi:hypothetical protein